MNKIPKELVKFFEKYEVLIVDRATASRSRLKKTLMDLGAKQHRIHNCAFYEEALEYLKTKEIGMVISDYAIGNGSGFDLFREVRQSLEAKNRHLTLILVTSNMSQNAVAQAAEEDVDNFITKPYTAESIFGSLTKTIRGKIRPSKYTLAIEKGKELLDSGKLQESFDVFTKACDLNSVPTLALFYMGQIKQMQELIEKAEHNFNRGVSLNKIHFKCLLGLYEIFMDQERYESAYEIVRKIAKYFPTSPERLAQAIYLSVLTRNFGDMHSYYDSFKELEERTNLAKKYVGAGLFISGKYFLMQDELSKALQKFDALAVSCPDFPCFFRAIIVSLYELNHHDHLNKYMKRFGAEYHEDKNYLIADFILNVQEERDPHKILTKAEVLIQNRVKNNRCHAILKQAVNDAGLTWNDNMSLEEDPDREVLPALSFIRKAAS